MTTIQKVAFRASGVMPASSSAGPDTNTAPTSTISTMERMFMAVLALVPRYLPMSSGRLAPLLRMERHPEKKSCTAPASRVPRTIHR